MPPLNVVASVVSTCYFIYCFHKMWTKRAFSLILRNRQSLLTTITEAQPEAWGLVVCLWSVALTSRHFSSHLTREELHLPTCSWALMAPRCDGWTTKSPNHRATEPLTGGSLVLVRQAMGLLKLTMVRC